MKINQKQVIDNMKAKYPDGVFEEIYKLKIFIYRNPANEPCVVIWKGRRSKPDFHYHFKSDVHCENFLAKERQLAKEEQENEAERKALTPSCKPGDIFKCSWGYDQTNVDFYQLIKMVSRHYALFREIGHNEVPESMVSHGMACEVTPDKDNFISDPFRAKIQSLPWSDEPYIKVGYHQSAFLYDGSPTYKSWYA